MTGFEIYTLFLCIIVFTVFTVLFTFLITYILRTSVKLILLGGDDNNVMREAPRLIKRAGKKNTVGNLFTTLICLVLAVIFIFAILMSCQENDYAQESASLKVVKSGSMERKNEKNTYLFENNINNQIGTFDLIVTHPLPKEEELKLYDIVVYELDGDMILHRIIGIEEPNAKHPDERYFLLRGDSVSTSDPFPVKYSQMRAIYKNERIPFVGSLIAFLQSPAGWLCIILTLFAIIATPIGERRIAGAILARYEVISKSAAPVSCADNTVKKKKEKTRAKQDTPEQSVSPMCFDEMLLTLPHRERTAYASVVWKIRDFGITTVAEGLVFKDYGVGKRVFARFMIDGDKLYVYTGLSKDGISESFIPEEELRAARRARMPLRVRLNSKKNARLAARLILEASV